MTSFRNAKSNNQHPPPMTEISEQHQFGGRNNSDEDEDDYSTLQQQQQHSNIYQQQNSSPSNGNGNGNGSSSSRRSNRRKSSVVVAAVKNVSKTAAVKTKNLGHAALNALNTNNKQRDMRWEELQRIESRRRKILQAVEEPFWKTLTHWDGTVIRQIAKDSMLWLTLLIYILTRVGARVGLPAYVAQIPTGGNLTVLGSFISFFLVFYVNQSHKRFFGLYGHSMACKGRIFDVATLARASLPPERAHRIVRYMNAAHAAGYVGLSKIYPAKSYFEPTNERFQLLTPAEKKRMDTVNMDAGGSAYRELIVWSMLEVQSAKKDGLLDREHATLMRDLILQLRASMGQLYNAADLPIPFFYVHFICLLTALYLPLFAVTGGIKAGTGEEAIWVTDIVAGLVVALQSVFVIGLRVLGQKISDPYGDDLVDLSVMFYIEFTWTQSNRILYSQNPPEPEPTEKTEEELQRNRITIGNAWDGNTGHGLGPIGMSGGQSVATRRTSRDDDDDDDDDFGDGVDDSAEFSQSDFSVIREMTASA